MQTKICSKCKTEKGIEAFNKDKRRKDGLYGYCKECRKRYYVENKEHIKKCATEYNAEHRERHDEYNKIYKKENKDLISAYFRSYVAKNLDKVRKNYKKWKENNPEYDRTYGNIKRSRKRSLEHSLTPVRWELIKTVFGNACAYCGKPGTLHQDHFIALTKNGEYSHNNIIPACPGCNHSKHNASFFDWYPKQTFYSKRRESKILKFFHYENGLQQLALSV